MSDEKPAVGRITFSALQDPARWAADMKTEVIEVPMAQELVAELNRLRRENDSLRSQLAECQRQLEAERAGPVTIDERKRKDFCFHGYAWDEHCIVCDQPEWGRGDTSHVCGLEGYNGMIDPPCPGCESEKQPQTWCGEVAGVMDAGVFRCNLPAGHAGEHRHRFRNGSE